jgi:DNA-directed RNA polymerase specialized sigma24 family protein
MTKTPAPVDPLYTLYIEDRCAPEILERVVREAQPYLERTAAYIAEDYPAARADLVQEANITLWQIDLGRYPQSMAAYLRRMLHNRMCDVYEIECRHGLTSGRSKRGRPKGSKASRLSRNAKTLTGTEK